ncbi:hypothetical protein [Rhodococcus xishaensis]|nr:hypothetical protein [Rhodococcus xishaensis]
MGDWTVWGRDGTGKLRWLNHTDDQGWAADEESTMRLEAPNFGFPVTPTGPWQHGIPDEPALYAAALVVIPGATKTAGEVPHHPALDYPPKDDVVY